MYDNSIICDMCKQEQVQPGGKYEIHKWVDLMNFILDTYMQMDKL